MRRSDYIGGSDAAAIVGLDRWRSAHDVYLDKIGSGSETPMNERMEWGTILEAPIRAQYRRRTGRRVKPAFVQHPELGYIAGHVDGEGDALLEVKTGDDTRDWGEVDPESRLGEPSIESIPVWYRPQVVHYQIASGRDRADVVALLRGHDFRMYLDIPRPAWAEDLLAEEVSFWTNHVIPRTPPEPDGSAGSGRLLRTRHPVDDGSELVALPHQYDLLDRFRRVQDNKAQAEAEEERLKQTIQAAMGEASYLLAPGVRISWKRSRDGIETDWQNYAGHLEALLAGSVGYNPDFDIIRGLYDTRRPGSRRFLVRFLDPEPAGGVGSSVRVLTTEGSNQHGDS